MVPDELLADLSEESLRRYAEKLRRHMLDVVARADYLRRSQADLAEWRRRKNQLAPTKRQIRDAAAEARRISIMRLAARGWSNKAIAMKMGIHPASVSRIVHRQLKAATVPVDASREALKDFISRDPFTGRMEPDNHRERSGAE